MSLEIRSQLSAIRQVVQAWEQHCEEGEVADDYRGSTARWLREIRRPVGPYHFRTADWYGLRDYGFQQEFIRSRARYNICHAARRAGKTLGAKRRFVEKAIRANPKEETYFIAAAPTHKHAKKIYWRDLCRLIPKQFVVGRPSKSDLTIELVNKVLVMVAGMDVPERVEGPPLGHILLDEYANMKPEVWPEHVQPALVDSHGTADFIGTPEGRNHYWQLVQKAREDPAGEWRVFSWSMEAVQDPVEVEKLRSRMDDRTFRQETKGTFESWGGTAYYAWNTDENCCDLQYDPALPLLFCFDFNVNPGCAVVAQEFPDQVDERTGVVLRPGFTGFIDEVWIEKSSNTPLVCRELIRRYRQHTGEIICYGDPAGGQRRTSAAGTDWQLIEKHLDRAWPGMVEVRVRSAQPAQRARLNAMNSRIRSEDGTIRLRVDGKRCRMLVQDLEGVNCLDNGEIDKRDKMLTHVSDAASYLCEYDHSVEEEFWLDENM